jgi:hypothetical protein
MMSYKIDTYNINKYVSDRQTELNDEINKGKNLLLDAPTGSGKTYAIIEYSKSHPNKQIAFLMPTRSLVDNLKAQDETVPCGYGAEWLNDNKSKSFIISTWDSINHLTDIDILFIDEAHLLAGSSSYRDIVLILLKYERQKILISGTPEIIEWLPIHKKIVFKKYQTKRYVDVIQTTRDGEETIRNIIQNKDRDRNVLTLIRHNSKETLMKIYDTYKTAYGDKIAMFYSANYLPSVQSPELVDDLKKGIVQPIIEILLCTSIYDAGLSLKVSKPVNCYAIANKREPMPNAIDMVQLLARVRVGQGTMKLTLIGKYGNLSEIEETKLSTNPYNILKQFDYMYDCYSEYDMETYNYILEKYKIQVNEVKEQKSCYNSKVIASNCRNIYRAKNFHNFTIQYTQIAEMLKASNNSEWLDVITGDRYIKGKTPTKVYAIYDDFVDAITYNIHFRLFVDKIYDGNKLKNLVNAVQKHKTNDEFRAVMDDLLSGMKIQVKNTHKMNLDGYKLLIKAQQEMIKTVSTLFYSGRKWNDKSRKTILLKRLVNDDLANQYLKNYSVGVDDTFKLLEFKKVS